MAEVIQLSDHRPKPRSILYLTVVDSDGQQHDVACLCANGSFSSDNADNIRAELEASGFAVDSQRISKTQIIAAWQPLPAQMQP
ncbi:MULTISPECIES: hypothetical protein [unclassified Rhizobium]|uniref:hypothetical protein n=1 Tax=unclassified Rhizobium TaxID=2613769 RepID=UPI0021675509|nr:MULTISPECIES: hypothetical protein [unclassified Rhizobium]MCS3742598.1 hypothetical protein [Rhizobium sp. BK661]MCS4094564.1 hypothetical protein [Rhizobium sp. BK176]